MKAQTSIFIILLSMTLLLSCGRNNRDAVPGTVINRQVVLDVPLIGQQTDQWCWAASAEMVLAYHKCPKAHKQCDQAKLKFGKECCAKPTPSDCIKPSWPQYQLFNFGYYNTEWGQALSWQKLKTEIDNKRPISFAWGWRDSPTNSGHMMDVVGYVENDSKKLVVIHDPWLPSAPIITYDEYISSAKYEHWVDYYEIMPKLNP